MKAIIIILAAVIFGFTPISRSSDSVPVDARPVASDPVCSDGWRITGYYTPVESDFTGTETREIETVR